MKIIIFMFVMFISLSVGINKYTASVLNSKCFTVCRHVHDSFTSYETECENGLLYDDSLINYTCSEINNNGTYCYAECEVINNDV